MKTWMRVMMALTVVAGTALCAGCVSGKDDRDVYDAKVEPVRGEHRKQVNERDTEMYEHDSNVGLSP